MPRIRCVAAYAEGDRRFKVGEFVDANEEECGRLMRGAPSSWEVVEGVVRLGGPSELVNYHEVDPPSRTREGAPQAGGSLGDMSMAGLRALAEAEGIDISGQRTKAAILGAIEAALAAKAPAPAPEGGEDGDDVDIDEMTDEQLAAYAARKGVDTSGKSRVEIEGALEALEDEDD